MFFIFKDYLFVEFSFVVGLRVYGVVSNEDNNIVLRNVNASRSPEILPLQLLLN